MELDLNKNGEIMEKLKDEQLNMVIEKGKFELEKNKKIEDCGYKRS